ncbi:MAG: hypothetical protein DYG92_14215 [Leptolyngbya sp. PLA1]|nr:hypothetical protein [Leptolyngbya sp. PLA1]
MRIIAGDFRSRKIYSPPDDQTTRPIPDRVKESLFSLLRGRFENANVFDGFAGTGSIGLECASRGAARVVCVEKDRDMADLLRANVALLNCADRVEVVCGDALGPGALARSPRPLNLAFLDPPYPLMQEPTSCRRVLAQVGALVQLLDADGFLVLRTPWPLRHPDPATAQAAAPTPEVRRRKPKRDDWKQRLRDEIDGRRSKRRTPIAPTEPDDADEPEGRNAEASAPESAAPQPVMIDVDLRIPGAKGPETHVYRQMAVHLYMRA